MGMGLNFLGDESRSRGNLVNRIFLTLGIILFARLGTFIPLPGIDQKYLYTELQNSPILNFFSSFSQGDFFVLGPFTLGILPNINASISMQLLSAVFPALQKLQKEEGVAGQKKVTQYTRYLTVVIAFVYGLLIAFFFKAFCIWVEFCSSIRNCEYSNHWFNYHFVVKRVNYRKRGREWNLFVYFC